MSGTQDDVCGKRDCFYCTEMNRLYLNVVNAKDIELQNTKADKRIETYRNTLSTTCSKDINLLSEKPL